MGKKGLKNGVRWGQVEPNPPGQGLGGGDLPPPRVDLPPQGCFIPVLGGFGTFLGPPCGVFAPPLVVAGLCLVLASVPVPKNGEKH